MIKLPNGNLPDSRRCTHWDHFPCAVCGACVRNPQYWVEVIKGGAFIAESKQEAENSTPEGRMYWFPVGPNCLRRHPELWEGVTQTSPWQRVDVVKWKQKMKIVE